MGKGSPMPEATTPQAPTQEQYDPFSFDPVTFAQEIMRPVRVTTHRLGVITDNAAQAFEYSIREALRNVQECRTFAGRELLRLQMSRLLKIKRDIMVKAIIQHKEREEVLAESVWILRAVSTVAMAFL